MQRGAYPTNRKQLIGSRTGKSFLVFRGITPRSGRWAFSTRRDDVRYVSSSSRSNEDDNRETPPTSRKERDRLARQEEIISLFRKIQSSISKGEKAGSEDESPEDDEEKPAAESILEIIRQSRKKAESKIQANRANRQKTKISTVRIRPVPTPKKNKEAEPIPDNKVPRLPSNFVKRSPIPFPSAPRGEAKEPGEDSRLGSQKLEGLKLEQLKEVAKSRGLRGYSKLKKTELVQLLISQQ